MTRLKLVARTSFFLSVKALLILLMVAWAATSTVQNVNYTGESGSINNTDNKLLTTAKGFSKATSTSAAGTSCGSPVTFGSGTVANTALTTGHVMFDAQVNTTASTPNNTCFTVTFYLSTSISSQSQYGPVYISTGGSITSGQAIDCKFDTASSSPPSPPFSYRVTVA